MIALIILENSVFSLCDVTFEDAHIVNDVY